MAIEVLLMSDVPDLGSEGDVVRVSDGFARNFLYPRKLAAAVTAGTRRKLLKIQKDREEARKLQFDQAREMAARLGAVSCTIAVKAADNEKLYGSVRSPTSPTRSRSRASSSTSAASISKSRSSRWGSLRCRSSCIRKWKPPSKSGLLRNRQHGQGIRLFRRVHKD
jgi:ribosomal protein L9